MSVYVALLEKIEVLDAGCFEETRTLAQDGKSWITLGHFDAMHTYELDLKNQNLFHAIQQNNKRLSELQKSNRYFHPLYMISSEDAQKFWKNLRPFFSIVKIHFAESVVSNNAYEQFLIELQTHSKLYNCDFNAFRTIELSDMILAVTADRLDSLLEFALTLRVFSCVGKVYTYACVDYELVKSKDWQPKGEDKIDLFSMRFSVIDFEQAKYSIKQIEHTLRQEQAFSVSGVDDIVVNWRELEVTNLIRLYRSWFLPSNRLKELTGQCFAEVTTRVGICLDKAGKNDCTEHSIDSNQELLQENCERLYMRCESIRLHANKQNYICNWIEPLSALTNTLIRISKTSVLDEFVYIMFAGVDAFLKNIECQIEHFEVLNTPQCQDFVENWAHLMEHIMRIEGQLTHNPQMRPILYDIPVAMLEYVLSFLKQVSEVLQTEDNPNKKDISFLLVPRLCDRIEAQEIFPAVPNSLPGLVLVTIPLQMLYDSSAIQQELSHEVSHFVGEVYRNRDERRNEYIKATAALMSRVVFSNMDSAFIEAIQSGLEQEMNSIDEPNIADMSKREIEWIYRIYKTPSEYLHFIKQVLKKNTRYPPLTLNASDTFITGEKIHIFKLLLKDLSILFREIYADICMIYLLDISSVEYVNSIYQDLISEQDEKKRRYEQIAIRLYVGLESTKHIIPEDFIIEKDEKLSAMIYDIKYGIQNPGIMKKRLIPITSIKYLLEYAVHCYEQLCKKSQPGLDTIRKMYNNVISPEMDYKRFANDINQYRTKILKQ